MKLITRKIEEKDWDTLCEWWNGHDFPIPSKDALPEHGMGGLIVEQDGFPVIAGFLFQTNTKGCWFEFIISNPDYKESREKITKELVNKAEIAAKILGYKYMLFVGKSKGLIKNFEELGWTKDPVPSFEMMKKIQ